MLAPRPYRLGKRAASVGATRRKIVEAAAALYRDQGIKATSMQQVARRADVAPGTVLNHYPDSDALADAVVEHLMASLRVPDETILTGLAAPALRVARLARELATFYERSEPWYAMYVREADEVPALGRGNERFWHDVDRLVRAALGAMGSDDRTVMMAKAVMNPAVFGELRAQGMDAKEAGDAIAEVLVAWLDDGKTTTKGGTETQ